MLFIIGGAPRVGKTIIAQDFLERVKVPFLSLDLLKTALVEGFPQAGINPAQSSAAVARQMWPMVYGFAKAILQHRRTYLIEGDAILPSHVQDLYAEHPGAVRACFLGFEHSDPSERLAIIRKHPGPEDWLSRFTDAEALKLIQEMMAFSRELRTDAEALGIPYFEVLGDFDAFKKQVLDNLLEMVSG